MMLFQSELGVLELLGQSADFGCLALLRKQETKRIDGDSPLPLRYLSQFLPVEEKINCLGNVFFVRTFHRWGDLIFIVGGFPNWMVIQTLFYWMGDFLSLLLSY